jgi:hypothetical protein
MPPLPPALLLLHCYYCTLHCRSISSISISICVPLLHLHLHLHVTRTSCHQLPLPRSVSPATCHLLVVALGWLPRGGGRGGRLEGRGTSEASRRATATAGGGVGGATPDPQTNANGPKTGARGAHLAARPLPLGVVHRCWFLAASASTSTYYILADGAVELTCLLVLIKGSFPPPPGAASALPCCCSCFQVFSRLS